MKDEHARALAHYQAQARIAQLEALLRVFVDGFKYDPGTSDLDNEQPIVSWVTLGHWRKADHALRERIC